MTQIFTAEELAAATTDEINARIRDVFTYDDYDWQKIRGVRTS
jgi:hypothetical protein